MKKKKKKKETNDFIYEYLPKLQRVFAANSLRTFVFFHR